MSNFGTNSKKKTAKDVYPDHSFNNNNQSDVVGGMLFQSINVPIAWFCLKATNEVNFEDCEKHEGGGLKRSENGIKTNREGGVAVRRNTNIACDIKVKAPINCWYSKWVQRGEP
eukprot:TRINITY_DN67_c1_g1_i4.p1 TRINITY_DN67_c1_g1~~TRINITY_DN67_c1_g1_i4.p1  ORF type:complete len:114 (-),score=20.21 TRINITY_DN67_c1_g1_i4:160-501(-)